MSPKQPHTSCPAWTNVEITYRSKDFTETDPRRVDGSKGTSTDQADTHIFPSSTFNILPPAYRSQGNRERPHGSAELDCRFWRQFDRQGMLDMIAFPNCFLSAPIYGRLQTAILRHVLSNPRYHVLHFDLRIADLAGLHMSLWSVIKKLSDNSVLMSFRFSQQMEQYFATISETMEGYGEFEAEALAFKVRG